MGEFPKILNGHKIRMINAIALQFSGFTSHMDVNKWWNFEKSLVLGWNDLIIHKVYLSLSPVSRQQKFSIYF